MLYLPSLWWVTARDYLQGFDVKPKWALLSSLSDPPLHVDCTSFQSLLALNIVQFYALRLCLATPDSNFLDKCVI